MKVLLTGAAGFLGKHLVGKLIANKQDVIGTGKTPGFQFEDPDPLFNYHQLDFTDPFQVHDLFEEIKPELVIHAGAMTRVDDCEEQQWLAYQNNVEGTLNLLMNAAESKSFFVFVSTDFVFDGEKGSYEETDKRNPVNFYGKTKREAEDAVMEYAGPWSIVRTSLVYGKPVPGKSNILSIVKDKLMNGEPYKLVDDQYRSPTYVDDLAKGIMAIIDKGKTGIYHLSGKDVLTPYAMGKAAAAYLQADAGLLERVTADNFSQPAKRPAKTNLIIEKARNELNYEPVSFEEGLKNTLI